MNEIQSNASNLLFHIWTLCLPNVDKVYASNEMESKLTL